MRVFISVLVLIFSLQSWTKADDISEFEIEGMSIGDTLLDFYSEVEINNRISISRTLKETNYKRACFNKSSSLYEKFCVDFKNDNKKVIYGVQGIIKYKKNNNPACLNKLREIDKEFSNIFKNLERKDWGLLKLTVSNSDGDTYYPIVYSFTDGSRAQIGCYFYKKKDSTTLRVVLYNNDIRKIVSRIAEKIK